MQGLLIVAARVVIAVAIMASASFVLGTVVAHQYHAMIVKLVAGEELERTYRRLVRLWYVVGISISAVVCFIIDDMRSETLYLLLLAALVILFWGCFWAHAGRAMRKQISSLGVGWEFFMSCFSLSLVSASTGVAMVDQIFKLFGWRQ